MLTKRQNLLETIHGGHPDRFVNQYEYMQLCMDPTLMASMGGPMVKGSSWINGFGVKIDFPDYVPGPFPDTSEEVKVIKDVAEWDRYLKLPPTQFSKSDWAPYIDAADKVDRNDQFVAIFVAPGIFEKLHYLMGMEDAMMNYYLEPEAMHGLIDALTEYEIACAAECVSHIHPDALFHHDDWGSQKSSFISPATFEEFIVPAYEKIYGFWKKNGVRLIVHHSDSYAENLVPFMPEMGIDIWQGAMSTNNIPKILKEYGGRISIHGGIDNGKVDREDWTEDGVRKIVQEVIAQNGTKYYIPGTTMGGAESTYPGLYEFVSKVIDEESPKYFGSIN